MKDMKGIELLGTRRQTGRMEHEHSPDAIRRRLESGPTHNYLRDWIYGGIDGAVTTLAVVTGVAGAQLSKWIILALGFANLFADDSRWRPAITLALGK